MIPDVIRHCSLPTKLLILLMVGALLGLSGHLVAADHAGELERCVACAWLQLQGWAAGTMLLLFFAAQCVFSFEGVHYSFSLTYLPRGRSPPHR